MRDRRVLLRLAASSSGSPALLAPSPTPAPAATAGAAPRPDHVVIVVLENKEQGGVMADTPFLASLAATASL